jgi:hypothetical protein
VDLAAAAKDRAVYWTLIGISIVIIFAAFSSVFGQSLLEAGSQAGTVVNATEISGESNFKQNLLVTLIHPKVLGVLILFAIAIMAIALLSSQA